MRLAHLLDLRDFVAVRVDELRSRADGADEVREQRQAEDHGEARDELLVAGARRDVAVACAYVGVSTHTGSLRARVTTPPSLYLRQCLTHAGGEDVEDAINWGRRQGHAPVVVSVANAQYIDTRYLQHRKRGVSLPLPLLQVVDMLVLRCGMRCCE